ncbi:MAG TPA: alpha/beta fold hydrolase [Tahibacter sp.]|nr:alpha/beta fold hydrolase [Tahibacter sp.]
MQPNPWLVREPSKTSRRLRLYCFCYAGGSAAVYLPWQARLDASIEVCAVQLPGRGNRMGERPFTAMPELIRALAPVIGREDDLPFAFFGHSLGGLVAFELARYRKLHYMRMPEHLIVSGCDAPQFRSESRRLHALPDHELIDVLKDFNGTPPEVLAHRELMDLLLPTIRADFALVDDYVYRPGLPLTMPITVLAGRREDRSVDQVYGWRKETLSDCRVHYFDGDHFFIFPEQRAVLDCIGAALAEREYA